MQICIFQTYLRGAFDLFSVPPEQYLDEKQITLYGLNWEEKMVIACLQRTVSQSTPCKLFLVSLSLEWGSQRSPTVKIQQNYTVSLLSKETRHSQKLNAYDKYDAFPFIFFKWLEATDERHTEKSMHFLKM